MEAIRLPADAAGFVRRHCPRCKRDFKTRRTDEDAAVIQALLALRLQHANGDELSPYLPGPKCLYCGTCSPLLEQLTSAQRSYVEACADHLGMEIQCAQLRRAEWSPGATYLVVGPGEPPTPPAEPSDGYRVSFQCCAEDAKADSTSTTVLHCPKCGAAQQRGNARIQLPLTVLEA